MAEIQEPYPEGIVVGPCICGSWPGGKCLKCPRTATPQQQAEPVTWDKPSDNFNDWWDGDRRRDSANPFTTDSFAYWAFEGWQAALAQRLWVGLTDEEMSDIVADMDVDFGDLLWKVICLTKIIEAKLKELNK